MNTDAIAIELIRGVAGSIGIILTVPLVSLLSAKMLVLPRKTGEQKNQAGSGTEQRRRV